MCQKENYCYIWIVSSETFLFSIRCYPMHLLASLQRMNYTFKSRHPHNRSMIFGVLDNASVLWHPHLQEDSVQQLLVSLLGCLQSAGITAVALSNCRFDDICCYSGTDVPVPQHSQESAPRMTSAIQSKTSMECKICP